MKTGLKCSLHERILLLVVELNDNGIEAVLNISVHIHGKVLVAGGLFEWPL